jgi:hypothetical protein
LQRTYDKNEMRVLLLAANFLRSRFKRQHFGACCGARRKRPKWGPLVFGPPRLFYVMWDNL